MNSLLAYVWTRRGISNDPSITNNNKNSNSNNIDSYLAPEHTYPVGGDEVPVSPPPPVVSASQSSDATVSAAQKTQDHHRDDDDDGGFDGDDNGSVVVTRTSNCPLTPEGLRPRRPIDEIREELRLLSTASKSSSSSSSDYKDAGLLLPPSSYSYPWRRTLLPPAYGSHVETTAVLPPRLPDSSSWSTQGVLSSPPPMGAHGKNRFGYYDDYPYDDDGDDDYGVAQSPQLSPTKARTAVGAVVALHAGQRYIPTNTNYTSDGYRPTDIFNRHSLYSRNNDSNLQYILPQDRDFENEANGQQISFVSYDDGDDDTRSSASPASMPYYPLNRDPVQILRKSTNPSPTSANSSLLGSPSSTLASRPYAQQQSSPVSQDGLMHNGNGKKYDFGPIVEHAGGGGYGHDNKNEDRMVAAGTEVVLLNHNSDQLTTVSAMSQSAQGDEYDQQEHGFVLCDNYNQGSQGTKKGNNDNKHDYQVTTSTMTESPTSGIPSGNALLLRKASNQQRSTKEKLVSTVLERLQDDIELVVDVNNAVDHSAIAMSGDWFVKTPLNKEGFLTGFKLDSRTTITCNLQDIIDETDRVFHDSSFTSARSVEEHDDLRKALMFCMSLIRMAVPRSELLLPGSDSPTRSQRRQGRWKFLPDFRAALGIVSGDSNSRLGNNNNDNGVVCRGYGGDTSVFSLPADSDSATPMTSNKSVATSIATSITTLPNSARFHRPTGQNHPSNGLQIRRTIEIYSSLLQNLSLACLRLIDLSTKNGTSSSSCDFKESSIRVTEELKRYYLQIMAMEMDDLRSLANAFRFDVTSSRLDITRQVSQDGDGDRVLEGKISSVSTSAAEKLVEQSHHLADAKREKQQLCLPPPPNLIRQHPAPSLIQQVRGVPPIVSNDLPSIQQQQQYKNHSDTKSLSASDRSQNLMDQSMEQSTLSTCSGKDSARYGTFSPMTDDMRTWNRDREEDIYDEGAGVEEFDDLRRQVGSMDHEDEDQNDERQGPDSQTERASSIMPHSRHTVIRNPSYDATGSARHAAE